MQTHELTDTLSLPLLLHLSLSHTHSHSASPSPSFSPLYTLSHNSLSCLYKEFTKYANWQTNAQLAQPKSSCNNNTNNNNTDNNNKFAIMRLDYEACQLRVACTLRWRLSQTHNIKAFKLLRRWPQLPQPQLELKLSLVKVRVHN